MKIKELLGFCGCKGCLHRHIAVATITAIRKSDGKKINQKRNLCKKHVLFVIDQGHITGLTTNCEVNFMSEQIIDDAGIVDD